MLAVMAVLDNRGTPVDDAALDAAGSDYFGRYRVDSSGAEESLIWRDLITRDGETLELTDTGASVAERCRADHPKHRYFYNEYSRFVHFRGRFQELTSASLIARLGQSITCPMRPCYDGN